MLLLLVLIFFFLFFLLPSFFPFFPLPSSSLSPAVLGLSCSPSSWNASPTRCWEELLAAYRLISPPTLSFLAVTPSACLSAHLNYSPFSPTLSHYFLPLLSCLFIMLVFSFSFLSPSYIFSLSPWLFEVVLSVHSGISKLCSITVECIRAQMLQGHYIMPPPSLYHSSHPSSLSASVKWF